MVGFLKTLHQSVSLLVNATEKSDLINVYVHQMMHLFISSRQH
jgi:hypothetical protein